MRGKDEYSVILYEFGLDKFYQWLNDEGFGSLCCQSERAIKLLIKDYPGYDNEQTYVKSITHILEYEKLINALNIEDFMNYIEWALGEIEEKYDFPYPPGLEELVCTPEEIRHQLSQAFSSKKTLPSLDFSMLLKNALEAIDAVCDALTEFGPATCNIYRNNLQNKIHEGIDKAFLYAENFVDLLLEFLVLTAEHCDIINQSDKEKLLFLTKKNRESNWGDKQKSIRKVCQVCIVEHDKDNKLEQLSSICRIAHPPLPYKNNNNDSDIGPLGDIIDKLRNMRNKARHAQLKGDCTVTTTYRDVAYEVKKLLQEAWDIISNKPFPAVMRMVGYSYNYYDKFEAYFISKDAKTITVRFIDSGKLIKSKPFDFLVFTEGEPEFFIYPPPKLGQMAIIDPLAVNRLHPAYDVQPVHIKLEDIDDFYEPPYAVV